MSAQISQTLFLCTSIVNRRHAGWDGERSTQGSCRKTIGYCWRISFKVLAVLFLWEVSSAFLPSKKACGELKFRHFRVRQQYPGVYRVGHERGKNRPMATADETASA